MILVINIYKRESNEKRKYFCANTIRLYVYILAINNISGTYDYRSLLHHTQLQFVQKKNKYGKYFSKLEKDKKLKKFYQNTTFFDEKDLQ